jgi:DNA-binding NtrC family response regulator
VNEGKPLILLALGDVETTACLVAALAEDAVELVSVSGTDAAEEALLRFRPAVAVFELRLEFADSGLVLAHRARRLYPGLPILLLSDSRARSGLELEVPRADARAWVKASAVLEKPVPVQRLRHELLRLLPGTARASDRAGAASRARA